MSRGLDIGGQAVIEGVMMKNRQKLAIAVRLENGKIKLKKRILQPLPKLLRIPFVRGVTTLIYILIIGIQSLVWSANQALGKDDELSMLELLGTLALSVGFALLFFVGVPFVATTLTGLTGFWFNVVDGVIRVSVFLAYVYAISFMKDVKRMFQYHGAEHMAVSCYEFGNDLTVDNVRKQSTIHPRCGTSFIMLVLILSIIILTFVSSDIWYEKLAWRVILVPVIAGVSYELLRLGGRFRDSIIMKIIIAPGLLVQRITTQKPEDKMIEVAITSLKAVVK
ncbi:MAG TPA: DUF1385 domain-containing protein [Candidatus Nanoarchaeia archaeon]|nr:DUF1385 domain-containing protein [Candidatus Nanoarchaeia archaeon]